MHFLFAGGSAVISFYGRVLEGRNFCQTLLCGTRLLREPGDNLYGALDILPRHHVQVKSDSCALQWTFHLMALGTLWSRP